MDAEALAFDDIYKHMANYTIKHTKRGYINGEEHQVIYLAEGLTHFTNEGRWLVKLRGEVSYVSPALYSLLSDNAHTTVIGQTLPDGTMMTRDKILENAKMRTLGAGSKAQQKQQQSKLLPLAIPPQPCTDSSGQTQSVIFNTGNTEESMEAQPKSKQARRPTAVGVNKRQRKAPMKDAFIVATRGACHVDMKAQPKRTRKMKLLSLPSVAKEDTNMNKRDEHQLRSLQWATGERTSNVLYSELSEDQRAEAVKQESQMQDNYRNVDVVQFM